MRNAVRRVFSQRVVLLPLFLFAIFVTVGIVNALLTGQGVENSRFPLYWKELCGDQHVVGSEQCDDGNLRNGDGCDLKCRIEEGALCPNKYGRRSICSICGNARKEGEEECDTGELNGSPDSGCDESCLTVTGWDCGKEGWKCTFFCGNGKADLGEECDDGNNVSGDGCFNCTVQASWECNKEWPSRCKLLCGNGREDPGEKCDDGNLRGGDGCTKCQIDTGWMCKEAPSKCVKLKNPSPKK